MFSSGLSRSIQDLVDYLINAADEVLSPLLKLMLIDKHTACGEG
jgi:hypothetical protein